jgi:hypothetical protein
MCKQFRFLCENSGLMFSSNLDISKGFLWDQLLCHSLVLLSFERRAMLLLIAILQYKSATQQKFNQGINAGCKN